MRQLAALVHDRIGCIAMVALGRLGAILLAGGVIIGNIVREGVFFCLPQGIAAIMESVVRAVLIVHIGGTLAGVDSRIKLTIFLTAVGTNLPGSTGSGTTRMLAAVSADRADIFSIYFFS